MLEWEGNNRVLGQVKYRDICIVIYDFGLNNLVRVVRSGLKRSLVDLKMNLVVLNEVGVLIFKVYFGRRNLKIQEGMLELVYYM